MAATHTLANFVAGLAYRDLPAAVRERARLCIMDWLGCVLAARPAEVSSVLRRLAQDLGDASGGSQGTLLAFGERASGLAAALVNGAMAHVVEMDDIDKDSIFHPAAPVVAAAMAAGEMAGVGGETVVEGVVAGYEVSTRVGRAINPSHYRFWHTTATVGTLGAAAAAGKVLGLDEGQLAHAINLSATLAGGLTEVMREENMAKPFHAGKAAAQGLMAALAARRGLTAASTLLDGPGGLVRATSQEPRVELLDAGLGSRWHILENTFKYHASCGHTHAAVDCVLALRAQGLTAADVERLEAHTYSRAIELTDKPDPRTVYEARFSLQYCMAAALLEGMVSLEQFRPQLFGSTELRQLCRRMTLVADPEADAHFPRQRRARVRVTTRDGRSFEHQVWYRKGDPENPVTPDELSAKFESLVRAGVGPQAAGSLREALAQLERRPVREFAAMVSEVVRR